MLSKLRQNAIITGYFKSFCLVCECDFDSFAVAVRHIDQNEHEKNLNLFPYFETYKNENIRKVKNGFFCEYCNMLMTTISNISVHVDQTDHLDNKLNLLFQSVNGDIIAFGKIIIDEKAWHTFMENKCALCQSKFYDESIHKSKASHTIKLIRRKVELMDDGLYHKINNDTIHCLTCNIVFASIEVFEHFNGAEHRKLYVECQEAFDNKYGSTFHKNKKQKLIEIKEMNDDYSFEMLSEPEPSASEASNVMELGDDSDDDDDLHVLNSSGNNETYENDDTPGLSVMQSEYENFDDTELNGIIFKNMFQNASNAQKRNVKKKKTTQVMEYQTESATEPNAKQDAILENKDNMMSIETEFHDKDEKTAGPSNSSIHYELDIELDSHSSKSEDASDFKITNNNNDMYNYNFLSAEDEFTERKQDAEIPSLISDFDNDAIAEVYKFYKHAKIPQISRRFLETKRIPAFIRRKRKCYDAFLCEYCAINVNDNEMDNHLYTREHLKLVARRSQAMDVIVIDHNEELPTYCPRENIPFKLPEVDFIWEVAVFQRHRELILNKTFCLRFESVKLVYNVTSTEMLCHVCDVKEPLTNVTLVKHINSDPHVALLNMSLVYTQLVEEYVREIFPNKFHCGFCNLVMPSFEDLKYHVRGSDHLQLKLNAYTRLNRLMPIPGQTEAIQSLEEGHAFTPNWTGRKPPGHY